MTLTVGSLFSGIGGLDLGLDRAGCQVAWQCEADEKCRELLEKRWAVPVYPDVKGLNGRYVPSVDVLCGGFPCQDLSVAGNRAGLAGERSGLFFEFMRLASEIAPHWVLIENVPGLLSSNAGRDMGTVLGTLADLGYGWAYRVLDAQYLGVAQRRRRVFIVGCLGDAASAAQVLFEPESCNGDSPPRRGAGQGFTAGVAACLNSGGNAGGFRTEPGEHLVPSLARSLTASERWDGDTETFLPIAFHQTHDPINGDVAPRLGATSIGMGVAFSENQRGEVRETPYSRQLTAGGGKPGQGYPAVRQDMAVRRLTPLECERLQGFPDRWTEGFSDSTRYRMLGNACCVPNVEWIARRLVAA